MLLTYTFLPLVQGPDTKSKFGKILKQTPLKFTPEDTQRWRAWMAWLSTTWRTLEWNKRRKWSRPTPNSALRPIVYWTVRNLQCLHLIVACIGTLRRYGLHLRRRTIMNRCEYNRSCIHNVWRDGLWRRWKYDQMPGLVLLQLKLEIGFTETAMLVQFTAFWFVIQ